MNLACFVIIHGSRSPRSMVMLQEIKMALQQTLPHVAIGGGSLEGLSIPLEEQIVHFSQTIGKHSAKILALPLFLLRGVHTQIDIPRALAQIGDDRWQLMPLLGEYPNIPQLLDTYWQKQAQNLAPETIKILLSHGSKFPGATTTVENIAKTIGAHCAYWIDNPNWEGFSPRNTSTVSILPYFLAGSGVISLLEDRIGKNQSVQLLASPLTPQTIGFLVREMIDRRCL